jgi:AraC family transcriptional regulator, transcriptional activator of the genes for pyochelin and ferripyochelin receptors
LAKRDVYLGKMTDIFTDSEYEQQHYESLQYEEIAENINGFDCIERSRDRFRQNYFWHIELRPGLELEFLDETYYTSLHLESIHKESMTDLGAKFYLSGIDEVLCPGFARVPEVYQEKIGHNYLLYLPDIREIEITAAGQRAKIVKIWLHRDLFRSFGTMDLGSLPSELRSLLETDSAPRFHRSVGKITAPMQIALQQILNCPYQGLTKRMYLEAKALELLSLQFAQWLEEEKQATSSPALQPYEIERIRYAKALLTRDLSNPPTLLELSRQVGLNDFKLKRGFRQVFGNTVLGCLQEVRMELAKQQLAEGNLSIAAIAHRVGYASQSHFCQMFKRQFGITPHNYRTSLRS